jgi:hypothetical protein
MREILSCVRTPSVHEVRWVPGSVLFGRFCFQNSAELTASGKQDCIKVGGYEGILSLLSRSTVAVISVGAGCTKYTYVVIVPCTQPLGPIRRYHRDCRMILENSVDILSPYIEETGRTCSYLIQAPAFRFRRDNENISFHILFN